MDKKQITKEIRDQLRAGFPDEAYKGHPTKTFLTTLKAMYVTERLNDVFGVGRWLIKPEVIERTEDYVLIKGVFESLDFDIAPIEQYGGHGTTGKNVEIADGYKSALTDCQSKIASYFEIGIDMFKGNIPAKGVRQEAKPANTANQTNFETRALTKPEVEESWNGVIYKGNLVYIDNKKIQPPADQIERLKAHAKFKTK